jgi:hypothetical protein
MTYLLSGTAFLAALAVAAPVWAQALTTQDLNRQELNRLATTLVASPPVVIADPVGLITADGGPKPEAAPFPGLLNLAGFGVWVAGSAVSTVLVGAPRY